MKCADFFSLLFSNWKKNAPGSTMRHFVYRIHSRVEHDERTNERYVEKQQQQTPLFVSAVQHRTKRL